MARPTFDELMAMDLPLAYAVLEHCPKLDEATRAADASLGRVFRDLFFTRR